MLYKIKFDSTIYPSGLVVESANEWKPYVTSIKTVKNSQHAIVELESIDVNACHEFSNYVLDKISSKELN